MKTFDDEIRSGLIVLAREIESTAPRLNTIIGPSSERSTRRKGAHRSVVAWAAIGVVLVGTGAVAAVNLLDDGTAQMVEQAPCDINSSDAVKVDSGIDSDGDTVEYWVITSAGGVGDLIRAVEPDGTPIMSALGCGPNGSGRHPAGVPYASVATESYADRTLVRLYGWMIAGSTDVFVTMNDGTTTKVLPGADGYFLELFDVARIDDLIAMAIDAVLPDGTTKHQQLLP